MVMAAAVCAAGGAHADDGILTWIVRSISANEDGDIIQASAMQVPRVGTALVAGQRISTADGQHMVLVNGRDLLAIRPNTTVTIGDDDPSTADADVDIIGGTIHVEVGVRSAGKTFSVGAPYLLATVKGTQFDVSSSIDASAVSVTEGVVAVSAALGGASVDVTAGNTAIVGGRNPDRPMLAPTPAGGAPSTIGLDTNLESAGIDGASSSSGSNGSDDSGSGLGGAVGDAADGAGDAVGNAASGVGGAVGGAAGAVGDAVGGAVGGAVSGVGGAVGGAVGGVGRAVGGLLGGGGNH
jgi:hypothetical protein